MAANGTVLLRLPQTVTLRDAQGRTTSATWQRSETTWLLPLDAGFLGTATFPVTFEFGLAAGAPTSAAQTPGPGALATGLAALFQAFGNGFGVAVAEAAATDNTWSWDNNWWGQLGTGTTGDGRATPSVITGLGSPVALAAGRVFGLALQPDGTVWGWGNGDSGALGTAGLGGTRGPMQLSGLDGVTAIAAGQDHALALRNDGTVWAWGSNQKGQLGAGDFTGTQTCSDFFGSYPCRPQPTQVVGLTDVVAIAAGHDHSVALKSDGTVWTWGFNGFDELGSDAPGQCGSFPCDSAVPVRAGDMNGFGGVKAISAQGYYTAALKTDGTVWTWGANYDGELGSGTFGGNRRAPAPVVGESGTGTLSSVEQVAAGHSHALALETDLTVRSWGNNDHGGLGDGTTTDRATPVPVSGLPTTKMLAAGWDHSLAVLTDGTLRAWGWNDSGQLGDGSQVDRSSPVRAVGLAGVTSISAHERLSLADPPYQCGTPRSDHCHASIFFNRTPMDGMEGWVSITRMVNNEGNDNFMTRQLWLIDHQNTASCNDCFVEGGYIASNGVTEYFYGDNRVTYGYAKHHVGLVQAADYGNSARIDVRRTSATSWQVYIGTMSGEYLLNSVDNPMAPNQAGYGQELTGASGASADPSSWSQMGYRDASADINQLVLWEQAQDREGGPNGPLRWWWITAPSPQAPGGDMGLAGL